MLQVQYHDIKKAPASKRGGGMGYQTVLTPPVQGPAT